MGASSDQDFGTIARDLLGWYDRHARVLPWRSAPGAPPRADDQNWPYRVWLSEVMLQQTTVAAVIPYFETFTRRWPDVMALAAADEAEVMAAWAGLGYYARARNLIACARVVAAAGGRFPDSEAALRELPGLGAYSAAAVAAIAFGRPAVVIDANVERVVSRLFAIDLPQPKARPSIRRAAAAITPSARAGDFAQAMMDLGSAICTTRAPRCQMCPLATHCQARAQGEPERFPVKAPKRAKPERHGTCFWIERDGAVRLVRRAAKGMLGAMRALPDDGWSARGDGSGTATREGRWTPAGVVSHSFTHFDLRLAVLLDSAAHSVSLESEGEWWPLDRLDDAGLPTVFAKAARLAQAAKGEA